MNSDPIAPVADAYLRALPWLTHFDVAATDPSASELPCVVIRGLTPDGVVTAQKFPLGDVDRLIDVLKTVRAFAATGIAPDPIPPEGWRTIGEVA